jgi:hypothetical protein
MLTTRQSDIANFLENLLHSRFSMETLNEKLSKFFNCKVEVENNTQNRLDSNDFDPYLYTILKPTR